MSGSLTRQLLSNSRVWSGLTVLLELSRAASYWFRPPVPAGPIENLIPYNGWALILLFSALLISVGSLCCKAQRLALLGHMIGVFCYTTFGTSILLDAALNGAGFASMGSLYVVALLHFGLTLAVGDRLGQHRQEVADAQPGHER